MNTTDRLLKDFVERFNRGVETGDFRSLLKLLAPDVVLTFHRSNVGPIKGRDGIAAHYRRQPPDDEIELIDQRQRDGAVVAGYSWLRNPDVRAGEMRFVVDDQHILEIEVTA